MKENEKKTITLCMSECGMGAYGSACLRFDFNSHHTQLHKIIFSFIPNGAFHVIQFYVGRVLVHFHFNLVSAALSL
jgi:hypothetical protein